MIADKMLVRDLRALRKARGLTLAQLAEACARADRAGMFTCPHTGVALACLEQLVDDGTVERDERVVVISTAHGLKFSEFKARYHGGELAVPATMQNQPVQLGSDPAEVVDNLRRALDERAAA